MKLPRGHHQREQGLDRHLPLILHSGPTNPIRHLQTCPPIDNRVQTFPFGQALSGEHGSNVKIEKEESLNYFKYFWFE